jgi:peptidoglycan/LPS O-acetylase OafA/YrhL
MEGVQATAGWNVLWITVAIIFAAAFSVIFWFFKKLGAALLLSYVFMLIGALICGLVNTFMDTQMEKWIALLIVLTFLIGGFVFGYIRPKFILMGTAIAGAYNLIGGVGTLASQFPVWDAEQEGWVWWMYFSVMVGFVVVGVLWQARDERKREDNAAGVDEASDVEIQP